MVSSRGRLTPAWNPELGPHHCVELRKKLAPGPPTTLHLGKPLSLEDVVVHDQPRGPAHSGGAGAHSREVARGWPGWSSPGQESACLALACHHTRVPALKPGSWSAWHRGPAPGRAAVVLVQLASLASLSLCHLLTRPLGWAWAPAVGALWGPPGVPLSPQAQPFRKRHRLTGRAALPGQGASLSWRLPATCPAQRVPGAEGCGLWWTPGHNTVPTPRVRDPCCPAPWVDSCREPSHPRARATPVHRLHHTANTHSQSRPRGRGDVSSGGHIQTPAPSGSKEVEERARTWRGSGEPGAAGPGLQTGPAPVPSRAHSVQCCLSWTLPGLVTTHRWALRPLPPNCDGAPPSQLQPHCEPFHRRLSELRPGPGQPEPQAPIV